MPDSPGGHLAGIAARLPAEIHAVLFDMDGVLIDSEPVHAVATRAALQAHGLPVPNDDEWESIFIGRPDRDGLTDWFALHAISFADAAGPVMHDKLQRFISAFSSAVVAFPDGQQLVRDLAAVGVPIALVTGARRDEAELAMRHYGLLDLFSVRITSDDAPRGKPDPLPYLEAVRLLEVHAGNCVIIEDSLAGVTAARNANIAAIAVDRVQQPERFPELHPLTSLERGVRDVLLSRFVRR